MNKKVIIVHGWGDSAKGSWFQWLKKALEKKGFRVTVPNFPDTKIPKIEKWVPVLKRITSAADENYFLVGHSIGCQAIMRWLETLPPKKKIGGAVFVAGWFNLKGLTKAEEKIARPWLKKTINTKKVKNHLNSCVAIFSNNDPYVPAISHRLFEQKLNARVLIEKNKGHLNGEDGVRKLPSVLKALLKISR